MSAAKSWFKRWLKLALLVVMMLSTIGAWEVCKGTIRLTGFAYADLLADHFKCYTITPKGPAVNEQVTLFDQFRVAPDGEEVVVRAAQLLCTPAMKTHHIPLMLVPGL